MLVCVKSSPIYSIRLLGLAVVDVYVDGKWWPLLGLLVFAGVARGVLFDTPYAHGFSRWLQLVMLPDFGLVLKVVEEVVENCWRLKIVEGLVAPRCPYPGNLLLLGVETILPTPSNQC